jgi:hypothetical protein
MVAGQAVGNGRPDMSTLLTTGVFVDRDTVEIGDNTAPEEGLDIYEIVDISTDSTVDVLTFWNNTDEVITQTAIDGAGDYQFAVGDYVAVESELAIVTAVVINATDDNDVTFYRGVMGSTIAAHATGTTAIEVKEATALTADTITVPTIAVTAVAGLDALAAIIGNDSARGPFDSNFIATNVFGVGNQLTGVLTKMTQRQWRFINYDDTTGFLISTVGGARGVVVDDAGLTNATLLPAATAGGSSANANVNHVVTLVPSAAEVTAGVVVIPCNFEPTGASVTVSTTATGASEAWDGDIILDRTLNLVTVDNTGLVDWATTSTVSVVIHGNVAVADCAVIG